MNNENEGIVTNADVMEIVLGYLGDECFNDHGAEFLSGIMARDFEKTGKTVNYNLEDYKEAKKDWMNTEYDVDSWMHGFLYLVKIVLDDMEKGVKRNE